MLFCEEFNAGVANRIAHDYVRAWNERQTIKLQGMMDDNVSLVDWEIDVQGVHSVIGANAQIWTAYPDIKITILNTAFDPITTKIFVEMIIDLPGEQLNVVDVIGVYRGKIRSIRAYKQ
jgi:hypothetical protein